LGTVKKVEDKVVFIIVSFELNSVFNSCDNFSEYGDKNRIYTLYKGSTPVKKMDEKMKGVS